LEVYLNNVPTKNQNFAQKMYGVRIVSTAVNQIENEKK